MLSFLIFSSLLGRGHDVNAQDELGFSPLHLIALLGRKEILHSLTKMKNTNIKFKVSLIILYAVWLPFKPFGLISRC